MPYTITNANPGNFGVDGVYIDQIPTPAPSPLGAATNLIGIIGTANFGPVNTATPFVDAPSLSYWFGNNSLLGNALLADAQCCMPEGQNFLGVRVTDGTDTAAAIVLAASSGSASIATLTARYTGALPNPTTTASPNTGVGAYATLNLVASSATASPQYQLAIVFPGYATESFTVNAYASVGGGYSASALIANLVAAVNGTVAGVGGSLRWTATAGTSTQTPLTATNNVASGGTNGTTTITTAVLLGTNTLSSRTGMYALSGLIQAAQFFIAGLTDPTAAATMASFAAAENAFALAGFASLTATATEQGLIANNNMISDSLFLTSDWDTFYDQFAGVNRAFAPMAKIAGIISGLPAYQYPGNQPAAGANGIIATDRTSQIVNTAEAQQRQASNILYLTNNPNLYNKGVGYGLPFGTTSSGKLISDVRMLKTISYQLGKAFGPLVGGMQGPLPTSGNDTDPFRLALKAAADGVLQPYLQANQIVTYTLTINNSNNSNTTIQQGFAFISVAVQTKAAARFIVTFLQVGSTVTFQQAAA